MPTFTCNLSKGVATPTPSLLLLASHLKRLSPSITDDEVQKVISPSAPVPVTVPVVGVVQVGLAFSEEVNT